MVDWNGLKYIIAEELGENMDIICFKYFFNTNQFEWHIQSHKEVDGFAAFLKLLQEEGKKPCIHPVNKNHRKIPSTLGQWFLALRYGIIIRKAKTKWNKDVDFNLTGSPNGFSLYTFSHQESNNIYAFCKRSKVSLSSLLIKTLDNIARKEFLGENSERIWSLPINMRGAVTPYPEQQNISTSIVIRIDDSATIETIHTGIKSFLMSGLQWGSWIYTNLPKYIGVKKYRKMVAATSNFAFGSLSNLGMWKSNDFVGNPKLDDTYIWMGASPSSRIIPINGTVAGWNGRLSLVLRLHPCLKRDRSNVAELLEDWLTEIKRLSGQETISSHHILSVSSQDIYGTAPIR
jgi:hypothetical protein